MIKHEGDTWVLYTKDGSKRLGEHATEDDAKAQERAIEASKHRAAEQAEAFRSLLDGSPAARSLAGDGDEHPFTYCMNTVVPAMGRDGKAPDDPEAFCGWWKAERAAQAMPDDAETRHLHVLGALGKLHTARHEGKDYLVVPVIALMEGVIHAVNADTPERVTLTTLQRAASTWNDKPIVYGHPTRDGKQCSANDPEIMESHAFGVIKNSRVVGMKLLMDAWIDPVKARHLGGEEFLARIQNGEPIEVSVGAYVTTDHSGGMFKGKEYKGTWLETWGDHLAFLAKGRGACSLDMGCGAHRAATHFVTAEGFSTTKPAAVVPQLRAASCGCKAATCGCKKDTHMTRPELIATLITDKFSGFKDGDEAILEAASDARLEEFRAAADAHKSAANTHTRLETDHRNVTARLKVAEDRLKTSEQELTEEEFLQRAPTGIKTLVERHKAEESQLRASLVSQLKDHGPNTEDELKKKSLDDLKTLAAYARVEVPDFSARGLPTESRTASEKRSYAPPDPYAAAIKELRSKTVN